MSSTTIPNVPTHDAPLTADGAAIMATLPDGDYELRREDGRVLVVRAKTGDAARPLTFAEVTAKNEAWLRKLKAAAGGSPA